MSHEVGVGTGYVRCSHHKAVAAPRRKHLFHIVGDLLWSADHRAFGVTTTANLDEVACRWIGLAALADDAVADAEHALHALQLRGRERLVDALGSEVKIERLRQQRQL